MEKRRIAMNVNAPSDLGQRMLKWITEGQALGGLIQGLLDDNERLRESARAAEGECANLRQEMTELRKEQEEMVGMFGKLMSDMLRPMDEMMQKIRGTQRRSPFDREASPGLQPESEAVDRTGASAP